ncbi:MAG: hypothetical protein O3A73_14905, partial [Proteobacteria bacterium]|nr:hypothetical protein [Pseudomonadota bacterium]
PQTPNPEIARLSQTVCKDCFEPAAPVGARDDHFEGSDAVLFPHIYGGIPTAAVASIGVLPKNDRGDFVDPGESE